MGRRKVMGKSSLLTLAKKLMKERMELPARKVGAYKIEHDLHPAGDELIVVGMREWAYTGLPMCELVLKEPTTLHRLVGPEGTWMTDLPAELVQMWGELAFKAAGRVLVGGLGLGVLARMVDQKASVHSTTVIEDRQEIIDLVGGHLGHDVQVAQGDLFEYCKRLLPAQYDIALLDIWQADGEKTWTGTVVPLRRLIGGKIKRVFCWHEEMMLSQVWQDIDIRADVDAEHFWSIPHYYAFRQAVVKVRPKKARITDMHDLEKMEKIRQENRKDPMIQGLERIFLRNVGSREWEAYFGHHWDESVKRCEPGLKGA